MKTVIIGRTSNLSTSLHARLHGSILVSARDVATNGVTSVLPREPFALVMNQFQPAVRLGDVSRPTDYVDLALNVTARLLDGILDQDCRKVLYTSSAAVYGNNVACREDEVPQAANLHAALKAANEHLIRSVCATNDVDYTIVRLFNLYGGRDTFSIVARIIDAVRSQGQLVLANEGNAVRDFIHVDDVVTCYQKLLGLRDLPVVNVATGTGTSVRSIVDAVRLRGHSLDTATASSTEIRISTADVTRLSQVVEVDHFVNVIDHVLTEIV